MKVLLTHVVTVMMLIISAIAFSDPRTQDHLQGEIEDQYTHVRTVTGADVPDVLSRDFVVTHVHLASSSPELWSVDAQFSSGDNAIVVRALGEHEYHVGDVIKVEKTWSKVIDHYNFNYKPLR